MKEADSIGSSLRFPGSLKHLKQFFTAFHPAPFHPFNEPAIGSIYPERLQTGLQAAGSLINQNGFYKNQTSERI
jgi:hypothetical protein